MLPAIASPALKIAGLHTEISNSFSDSTLTRSMVEMDADAFK